MCTHIHIQYVRITYNKAFLQYNKYMVLRAAVTCVQGKQVTKIVHIRYTIIRMFVESNTSLNVYIFMYQIT